MILDAEIQGIPCQIRVTHYQPEVPPIVTGPMDWADPGEPAEVEFDVLDQAGHPAPWPERKMLSEDRNAIEQEIIAAHENAFNEYGAYA